MSFPIFDILASRADLGPERMVFEDIARSDQVSYRELNQRTSQTVL